MALNFRIQLLVASLLVMAAALYDLWLWQPERQVLLHQTHFLEAAQNRNWSRFRAAFDEHYEDRWGHDKIFMVRECSEVLRQFFALTITEDIQSVRLEDARATVSARLKLDGNGTALAQYAQQYVNGLREPFLFEWTRRSWKPWDWQLTRADQPQLRIGEWRD